MASDVERIKEKIAIAELIGSYVKLERAGQNFKARCPFHTEKTPSFFVSPSRNSYYCFGCGAKGDVFSFVEAFESTDFMGALRILSARTGIPLQGRDPSASIEEDRLRNIHQSATSYFEQALRDHSESRSVRDYLSQRGLNENTVQGWRLGYAPNTWRSLYDHLRKEGFHDTDIERSGLAKRPDSSESERAGGVRLYDRFRGRIMFPLFDTAGRVIAFSGRILNTADSDAKYINSPETPLYRKSDYLYGLHAAKLKMRGHSSALVVEGQMDLLMCHQAGLDNAVALSGTALTRDHLSRIKRFTDRIVFALDSDNAGRRAGIRSAALALEEGLETRVVALPPNEDPADVIRRDALVMHEALKASVHLVTFVENMVFSEHSDHLARIREIRKEILPLITRMESKMEQAQFVASLSIRAGIAESSIWDDLAKTQRTVSPGAVRDLGPSTHTTPINAGTVVERNIIGFMNSTILRAEAGITTEALRERISASVGEHVFEELLKRHSADIDKSVIEAELFYSHSKGIRGDLEDLLGRYEEDYLRSELTRLVLEIAAAEQGESADVIAGLLEKYRTLSSRISSRGRIISSSTQPISHG